MPQLNSFFFGGTLAVGLLLASYVIFLVLILRSGRGYSIEDTETHASDYAGVIKEGHGGMTAFLWLSFVAMFIWGIVYFVTHWHEFQILVRIFRSG